MAAALITKPLRDRLILSAKKQTNVVNHQLINSWTWNTFKFLPQFHRRINWPTASAIIMSGNSLKLYTSEIREIRCCMKKHQEEVDICTEYERNKTVETSNNDTTTSEEIGIS